MEEVFSAEQTLKSLILFFQPLSFSLCSFLLAQGHTVLSCAVLFSLGTPFSVALGRSFWLWYQCTKEEKKAKLMSRCVNYKAEEQQSQFVLERRHLNFVFYSISPSPLPSAFLLTMFHWWNAGPAVQTPGHLWAFSILLLPPPLFFVTDSNPNSRREL